MPTGIYERKAKAETFDFSCEQCGKISTRPASVYKKRPLPKFCSSRCFGLSVSRSEPNRECALCKNPFRGRETARYCSWACQHQARRCVDAKWRDPAYIREYHRQYAMKARAAGGYDVRRQRVIKRGAATKEQICAALEKAKGMCVYCGQKTDKLTLDHATPIHEGGKHNIKNLVPCCKRCNSSKGTKALEDWVYDKFGIEGLARAYTYIARKHINIEFYP